MGALSPLFAHTPCPPIEAVGHCWAQSLMFTPVSPTTTPATPPVRRERELSHRKLLLELCQALGMLLELLFPQHVAGCPQKLQRDVPWCADRLDGLHIP